MQDTSERTIFCEAVAKPPGDRAAYLDSVCAGDPPMRARIEALLAGHEHAGDFLDSPAPGVTAGAIHAAAAMAVALERPGAMVGSYKLLEQIGEGGMGVVFMAEQVQPVRRRVALKIIKPGMDTKQVIARFEAERQALALMDHPNIAKVLEAGATAAGRPFFVMELVRGIPITEYCDQHKLGPSQRLELFARVCQAVQHAHQKGVIHRDLKPNNVLVTVADDGKPVPKIIDFGIAKATVGQRLTEQTLFTEFRQLVGTPVYMSPEQAEMSAMQDVDTRSDVYSLGVLLYELLTGTTPFDKQRLGKAAYDEVRRIIREEEPPRPSTRISTLGNTLTTVSAQRQTDPRKLSTLVRGELDWIVMRAMEKDRARRYSTAAGFAQDIQRYLADEPVEACPPSQIYRLRKAMQRNRAAMMTASAISGILIAATAVSVWEAFHARRAEKAARAAQIEIAKERDNAVAQKRRADEQAATAEGITGFYNDLHIRFDPTEEPRLRKQADWCMEDLSTRLPLALNVLPQLISVYGAQNKTDQMDRWQARLRDAHEANIAALTRQLDGMEDGNPKVKELLLHRGNSRRILGHFREALSDFTKLHRLDPDHYFYQTATLQLYLGDHADYRETSRQMLKHYSVAFDPPAAVQTVKACTLSADLPADLGQVRQLFDRLHIGPDSGSYYLLAKGMLEYREGNDNAAIQDLKLARRKFIPTLAQSNAENFSYTDTEAATTFFLSMAEYRMGDSTAARDALLLARWRLATQVPDEASASWKVGFPDWIIAKIAAREADRIFGKQSDDGRQISDKLPPAGAESPGPPSQLTSAIDAMMALGNLMHQNDQEAMAEQDYKTALELQRRASGEQSTAVGDTLISLARAMDPQGKYEEAEKAIAQATRIARDANDDRLLIKALGQSGYLLRHQKRNDEAVIPLEEALKVSERAFGPNSIDVAKAANVLAVQMSIMGNAGEAEKLYRRAIDIGSTLPDKDRLEQARFQLAYVAHLDRQRRTDEAVSLLRAIHAQYKAQPPAPREWRALSELFVRILLPQGNYEEVEAVLLEEKAHFRSAGVLTSTVEARIDQSLEEIRRAMSASSTTQPTAANSAGK